MANILNNETGRTYTVDALAIDVDEYIYGLGERFTPFVKNGQVVEMWNEDGGTASEIPIRTFLSILQTRDTECCWIMEMPPMRLPARR